MRYRTKNVKLDRDTDWVGMNTPGATWDGSQLKFELQVGRKLRSGDFEETQYDVAMTPEDALCALNRLRSGLRDAVQHMRERADELENEL